ncbi:hypothetical protein GCM10010094_44130 [Streptomyces flaveus]|uniref:Uncharacterized protein n=1 Tax=Streptomyces flaveus TaxID=66370 RepID=A0A917QZ43_9ACTN|nr:hypothetical protein GCM10010094_44130 [Streptomyces flaveus]
MFRWWKKRGGPELLASRKEQKRIKARFVAASLLVKHAPRELGTQSTAGVVHLITDGELSTLAHVELLERLVGGSAGIPVARLFRDDSEPMRAMAYRAEIVVGTLDDFIADFGHESTLGIIRYVAMVEGEPGDATRDLLSAYRSVVAA